MLQAVFPTSFPQANYALPAGYRCFPLSFPTLATRQGLSPTVKPSALIIKHEHDLPFKDVAVDQPATDAGNVLVGLHLLKLPAQEDCR